MFLPTQRVPVVDCRLEGPAASNRPITEQNTVKQITTSHEGPNGMGNRIKKAIIRHQPWALEAPNLENPTSPRRAGMALGYCPALKGRDELVEAIRKTPKTTFDAWGVVLGKVKNWSAPEGTNSEPTRVWLQLGNGIDRTPLIVGGPTRDPQRLTLQLGCRG